MLKTQITAPQLYEKLKNIKLGASVCQYSLKKCEELVPIINEINELKEEKNAVILAHSYISPEIIYGVSDFVGDSYKLSKDALTTTASTIVFVAVRFMGETAKILNPEKEVLIPAVLDGCSLADSITAQTVRDLRRQYPDHTFICYINTSAQVKAECDVTVTSANVYKVARDIPNDKIYFLPDKFMGQNLKNYMERRGIKKDIQFYSGTCYVHEDYGIDDILKVRLEYPDAKIVSHPECNSAIVDNSDFVGSTEQMLGFMKETDSKQFLMLTECGLSARLQSEFPDKQLVGSCTMCKFMKSNTLENILRALKNPLPKDRVILEEPTRLRALKTIEAMFRYAYMPPSFVETQYFTFANPPHELVLKSGIKLGPVTLAYETYGQLNADKSNAILIFHALTGDAHAAGWHKDAKNPGWWDPMIGPQKAFDTDKYFIICANVLGGCKGSTGPFSINPATGKPYGLNFPVITIEDMVVSQKYLIDHLGIKKLLAASGGSMGGLMALEWSVRFPDTLQSAILIATNYKHTAQQIALHEVARQAIMNDPHWNKGDYYGKELPAQGMSVSRMIGHITYMSERSMEEKFGRKLQDKEKVGYDFSHDFEVENYLKYRGASFVQRFDANSYLYLSKALDYFDLSEDTDLVGAFKDIKTKFLIITFTSDWLYPSYQSKDIVKAMKANDVDVSFIEIDTNYGHDSFLVEIDGQSKLVSHFLNNIAKK